MVNEALNFIKISRHENVEVVYSKEKNQHAVLSLKNFNAGDIIISFSAKETFVHPTYLTIQLDKEKHISLDPEYLQYTNHSCNPNVFFNTTDFNLVALNNIGVGEEITFFYPSTEFEMAQPFECFCQQKNCLGKIDGAKNTPLQTMKKYRVSAFIQSQLFL